MTPIGFSAIATLVFIVSMLSYATEHWVFGSLCLVIVSVMAIISYLIWGRDELPR